MDDDMTPSSEIPGSVPRGEHAKLAEAHAAAAGGSGKNKMQLACVSPNPVISSPEYRKGLLTRMSMHNLARLVFPTLQKNESPITILPTFLQVLGRKIEAATTQQDIYGMDS